MEYRHGPPSNGRKPYRSSDPVVKATGFFVAHVNNLTLLPLMTPFHTDCQSLAAAECIARVSVAGMAQLMVTRARSSLRRVRCGRANRAEPGCRGIQGVPRHPAISLQSNQLASRPRLPGRSGAPRPKGSMPVRGGRPACADVPASHAATYAPIPRAAFFSRHEMERDDERAINQRRC